jgi:hypothetical protein
MRNIKNLRFAAFDIDVFYCKNLDVNDGEKMALLSLPSPWTM